MLALPPAGWQRVAVAALLTIPLIRVVTLMSPALLLWPFLSKDKRSDFRDLIDRYVGWVQVVAGGTGQPGDGKHNRSQITD